jgi:hypothetical protein
MTVSDPDLLSPEHYYGARDFPSMAEILKRERTGGLNTAVGGSVTIDYQPAASLYEATFYTAHPGYALLHYMGEDGEGVAGVYRLPAAERFLDLRAVQEQSSALCEAVRSERGWDAALSLAWSPAGAAGRSFVKVLRAAGLDDDLSTGTIAGLLDEPPEAFIRAIRDAGYVGYVSGEPDRSHYAVANDALDEVVLLSRTGREIRLAGPEAGDEDHPHP